MRDLKSIKRVILKIGSSSIVNADLTINYGLLESLMNSFKKLQDGGIQLVLVTSGAIALGRSVLNLKAKPKNMALKQACAAIGQARLMEEYNNIGQKYGIKCGQILLNHDDFQIRKRLKFLQDCLEECLKNNVIPIINENDALAVEEIKVGDNDTLASLLVPAIDADLLILFSDIDGLYDKNPKLYADAKLINIVDKIDDDILAMAGDATSNVGTGGMQTKLNAAIMSTSVGCNMIICNSNRISDLEKIIKGAEIGTLFKAKKSISNRDHWIIFRSKAIGRIMVDDGLKKKLEEKKVSILPKGIIGVEGSFLEKSVVDIVDKSGLVLAKGITNYSSTFIDDIKGLSKEEILMDKNISKAIVIHADNLVIIKEDIAC